MFALGPNHLQSASKDNDDAHSSTSIHADGSGESSVSQASVLRGRTLRKELIPYLPYVDKLPSASSTAQDLPSVRARPKPWINFNILKDWIRTCKHNHEDHCEILDSHKSSSPWHGPLWLIDTVHRCLVPYKSDMNYFALSYVWGKASGPEFDLCLQKSTLLSMQKERYFVNDNDKPPHLPRLINDVVELVRRLDSCRYLWIDRYCIMQDDGPAKEAQISSMNAIYAGAFATLVMANVAADVGLKGIKGHSEPRNTRIPLPSDDSDEQQGANSEDDTWEVPDNDDSLDAFRDLVHEQDALRGDTIEPLVRSRGSSYDSWDSFVDYEEHSTNHKLKRASEQAKDRQYLEEQAYLLMHSPWYSRGWTFQESLFSRRKIIFQNNTVNWECHCTAWYEGQERNGDAVNEQCMRDPGHGRDGGFDSTAWPDLYRYARLVCLFNRRQLTFPEDALFAFAGVMNSLSRTFKYGFISGLPQMFFHSTLIWQPYRPMTRRLSRNADDPTIPSWSWAGWHGVMQYESWRSGYAYIKSMGMAQDLEPTSWKTFVTVKWHRLDHAGGNHVIKSLEVNFNNGQYPNDSGWKMNIHSSETGVSTTWMHENLPGTGFWHPVELRDPIKAHVPPIYCRHLGATTRVATTRAGASFKDISVSQCVSVDLVGDHGEWIGVLRLPTELPSNKIFEIIELSRGSVRKSESERDTFDEWDRPGFERCWADGIYEFYNVMAVSWKNGVAYREAVGRIEKSSWDEINTRDIDIVLG